MDAEDEWQVEADEAWREQLRIYGAMTAAERFREALAFDRSARRWTRAVSLEGTIVDRERDAAMERLERAMG